MYRVRSALARVEGVWEVGFDLANDSVFVSYDARLGEPADVSPRLIAALEGAGYRPAWLKAEAWPPGIDAGVVARPR